MRREARRLIIPLFLSALSLSISCQKDEPPPVVPPDDLPSVDTNWVRVPQVDIPWPSLANSPWPTYLHDPQHTGRSSFRGPQEGKVAWYFETGNMVYSSPVIGMDGTIYVQSNDHSLYALSPAGGLRWRFDMRETHESLTTLASDGTIYAGASTRGTLFALDQNGTETWEYNTGGSGSWRAPLISYDGETIYFTAGDSVLNTISLFALSKNGTLRWKFTPQQKDLTFTSPAISPDGRIYCPGQGGAEAPVYALDTSGSLLWRFIASGAGSTTHTSSISIDNSGNIYFVSGATLYSVTRNGVIRWQAAVMGSVEWLTAPVIGWDGSIYVSGTDIYAFDNSGKRKWEYEIPDYTSSQSVPAIDIDGTLYFGTLGPARPHTANFYALNPDGSLKWRISLANPAGEVVDVTSRPAIGSNGRLYVGSDGPGKGMYAIQ